MWGFSFAEELKTRNIPHTYILLPLFLFLVLGGTVLAGQQLPDGDVGKAIPAFQIPDEVRSLEVTNEKASKKQLEAIKSRGEKKKVYRKPSAARYPRGRECN